MLSPIILFVYNRPVHTINVLNALAKNDLSKLSELFIFSDGPKFDVTDIEKNNVNKVREIIKNESRFLKVNIFESKVNKGLSKSIIEGVNLVLNLHQQAIILEDDIVPENGFLKYMNDALLMYKEVDNIGCIHGWNYSFNKNYIRNSTFLLKGADCWGWATWKRSWELFEEDGAKLLKEINAKKLNLDFDRNDTHPFCKMLEDQISGKNDSWAIRWHASLFLKNKFCLQPNFPLVKNIGFDGSGTHCGIEQFIQITTKSIKLKQIDVFEDSKEFYKSFDSGLLNVPISPFLYHLNFFKNKMFFKIKEIIKCLMN